MAKEFKLSAALMGHSLDVRSVTITNNDSIISGSRDKTAKLWTPNGYDTGYTQRKTFTDQKNFVISVLYLEPTAEYPDGLVVAGGNDNIIYVYNPSESFAFLKLSGHTNAVSCLSKCDKSNGFLSGSWDTTGKIWCVNESKSALVTLTGHSAAIWAIIQLNDTRIATASADKSIALWSANGQILNTLLGHTDCVRGLIEFPETHQIVSISNDATIKVWNYEGENIDTYYGHTNYIYSIARGKSSENFVTSDENRTVRYWHNGINVQTFQLPAQSVWSVGFLSNGDIVTGSSDGIIRIFTQNNDRVADEATLNRFNEEVEAEVKQSMQEIGGYKVSDLPGKEALYNPGEKAGQMKMIREGNGVCAYTWVDDGVNSHWEKVGEVLGSTDKDKQDKTMYEGKSYDFVFNVDVEDGKPPLKLPYNIGDDPYVAANNFITKNMLPSSYLEQIVDFILKNSKQQQMPISSNYVDPFTGTSRYTPGTSANDNHFGGHNVDPFTGTSSYSTSSSTSFKPTNTSTAGNADPFTGSSSYTTLGSQNPSSNFFPQTSYRYFEMGDTNVILSKLKEFNKKIGDGNDSVNEKCLEEFVKICNGFPNDPEIFDMLFKLLEWPDDIVFPVLDVIRMGVRDKRNNRFLATIHDGIILRKILTYINTNCNVPNNTIVSLRILCNLFSHIDGENAVFDQRFDILENITSLSTLSKNGQIALSTFLLNLTIATLRKSDEIGTTVLGDVIPDILTKLNDPESLFRGYVALGTLLLSVGPQQKIEIKIKVKSNDIFCAALENHMLSGQGDIEAKKVNCVKQVKNLMN